MIQATNELILGIELNEDYAQMTYYHQSVKEPVTFGASSEPEQILLPVALRRDARGVWHFWDGGKPESGPGDTAHVRDLYRSVERGQVASEEGEELEPAQILAEYFGVCLRKLEPLGPGLRPQVMVTVRELTREWGDVITEALERNGLERRVIYLQDYLSSFYYYTINQKKELWRQDVALIEYEHGAVTGYVLHIDRSTRPGVARAERVASQPMDETVRAGRGEHEWRREKDRLFFELLKKVFERRTISTSYLMGDYFNKSWAERSIQYLCHGRHAFQGRNLYSKGACYAAMERAGLLPGRDTIFGGRDMIEYNLGMEMRIRGKDSYYLLVSAGINWYEAHHVCEFVLNHEREIRVVSSPMTRGDNVVHILRLTGLPPRQERGTRVRMTVYFSSPYQCVIEVEDLGFGEFYRPSGLTWSRTIEF